MSKEISSESKAADSTDLAERFVALQEFIEVARERLPAPVWGYVVGATETETTQLRNRQAIENLALRPRVLNDVSEVDTSASLLGRSYRLPVLLAPIGGLESFDEQGALAVARSAASFKVPMMLSSVSRWSMDDVMGDHTAEDLALIYQLYVRDGAAGTDQVIEHALSLGSPAFCFTVDSAVYSRRERDIVARFVKPWRASSQGQASFHQAAFSWADIRRLRETHQIPFILKGIATAEDAELAVEHGIDVIYVSNHGGRQLDHGQGTMAILPEVVRAVDKRAKIIVDGGFCRGTDLVKALALGADFVGLGRMMCYALAAAGAPGIVRMLEILEDETRIALALLGARSVAELHPAHVVNEGHSPAPVSALSAFPLLDQGLRPGNLDD